MKSKSIERYLAKNFQNMVRLYGLQDVDIVLTVRDTTYLRNGRGTKADTSQQAEYNSAEICIYAEAIVDEDDLYETICHELEHVVHSPMELFRDIALSGCLVQREREMMDRAFLQAAELTRSRIRKMRDAIVESK